MINPTATTPLLYQEKYNNNIPQSATQNDQEVEPSFGLADAAIITHIAVTTAALLLLLKNDKAAGIATLLTSTLTGAAAIILSAKEDDAAALQHAEPNANQSDKNLSDQIMVDMINMIDIHDMD